jgi:hypothetical protein
MYRPYLLAITGIAALSVSAQTFERRADITGGGEPNRGKCTIEVVVDGAAQVEIRGESAQLRNVEGQPPQWRRFVCNAPMPLNPAGFRFAGVDGRGRQTLVRAPGGGAPAIIRIEDPQNGTEGYTFDIFWQTGTFGGPPAPIAPAPDRRFDDRDSERGDDRDRFYRERDEFYRGGEWRGQLFARVRRDLDYAARDTFRGDDRYRLDSTYRELDELQRDYASGRWDREELDDVIRALDRVVDDNRLPPRSRDILRDDLDRLRDLRGRR